MIKRLNQVSIRSMIHLSDMSTSTLIYSLCAEWVSVWGEFSSFRVDMGKKHCIPHMVSVVLGKFGQVQVVLRETPTKRATSGCVFCWSHTEPTYSRTWHTMGLSWLIVLGRLHICKHREAECSVTLLLFCPPQWVNHKSKCVLFLWFCSISGLVQAWVCPIQPLFIPSVHLIMSVRQWGIVSFQLRALEAL